MCWDSPAPVSISRSATILWSISTMLRWGNYDYATNQTYWNPDEVPAGHPVPTQVLPASLFLSERPSWWGATAWPADRT